MSLVQDTDLLDNELLSTEEPTNRAICLCCELPKTTYNFVQPKWECNLHQLKLAAENGCLRCSFLAKCVTCVEPDPFHSKNLLKIHNRYISCSLSVYYGNKVESYYLDIFLIPGQSPSLFKPSYAINKRNLLPGDTSSETTISRIKTWINECTLSHGECNQANADAVRPFQFPKRILEVGGGHVRLRENPNEEASYACLSHCWGTSTDIIKTTTATLENFKISVPWSGLTKTFQDAVDVCRRLDVYYLWIDSLCILQDSEDDWKEESSKMAGIFENAFFTIAATRSKDGSVGCYAKTDSCFMAQPVFDNIYVRKHPPRFPRRWIEHNTEMWPLLARGWTYQELRLSPRILHFCSQEVMWECRSARRCESGCSDQYFARSRVDKKYPPIPYSGSVTKPRQLWYRTVQDYSRLQLTFEKDKLPALAALAERMQGLRVGDRYLAGVWEKTLLLDLLWFARSLPESGRPEVSRAPTWSWPSVRSQVMWDERTGSILSSVKLKAVRCTPVGPTHMGELSEATITLEAPLIRAIVEEGYSLSFNKSQDFLENIGIYDPRLDYAFDKPGNYHIPYGSDVSILPLALFDRHIGGIVLKGKPESIQYERVGYVQLVHREYALLKSARTEAPSLDEERHMLLIGKESMKAVKSVVASLPVFGVTII